MTRPGIRARGDNPRFRGPAPDSDGLSCPQNVEATRPARRLKYFTDLKVDARPCRLSTIRSIRDDRVILRFDHLRNARRGVRMLPFGFSTVGRVAAFQHASRSKSSDLPELAIGTRTPWLSRSLPGATY
jgi:hypothetical protein